MLYAEPGGAWSRARPSRARSAHHAALEFGVQANARLVFGAPFDLDDADVRLTVGVALASGVRALGGALQQLTPKLNVTVPRPTA